MDSAKGAKHAGIVTRVGGKIVGKQLLSGKSPFKITGRIASPHV
jgi:hypothetical protein